MQSQDDMINHNWPLLDNAKEITRTLMRRKNNSNVISPPRAKDLLQPTSHETLAQA